MFAQLGKVRYELLKGFDSWSNGGADAVYAEHEVIGGKSRLQKTGDDLKELSLSLKLRANYCNPSQELALLDDYKTKGEILPLLLGNGNYVGDFVVTSTSNTVDECFADGTPIQITANLVIREFVAVSKLELQQQAARRNATSVGINAPVTRQIPQALTQAGIASKTVTQAMEQTNTINTLTARYKANESQRTAIQKNIEDACDKASKHLDDLNDQLQKAEDLKDKYNSLGNAATDVRTKVAAVKNAFPLQDPENIGNINAVLQSSVSEFKSAATPLQTSVITRKKT
jgi:phage protein U